MHVGYGTSTIASDLNSDPLSVVSAVEVLRDAYVSYGTSACTD